ncbi:formate/nitrite transporter family protein [Alicyclobacillus fastidiosus]|uniref:Formate/nitrite transporter family protein n=1 Tax=Alicyclobacillus fastidiosus TaxID=392011 RepID=A0ABV5AG38_9BACL|nr:formate/nitrite transporter family protein [Alicyclobacillus fastidiosus]WEH08875.1 formate/nitrite transporter family protein [Alicyclobacillus fastidiosus]
MSNNFLTPAEITAVAAKSGEDKAKSSVAKLLILGFLAGAFIAFGALFDIRVTASIPAQWGSIKNLVGGAVFPVGLMLVVVAGGELLTGNMMTLPLALHERRIRITGLIYNWFWVLIGNLIGSLFVAYFFGVVAKMLTDTPYKEATIAIAVSKAGLGFGPTIISAIGCNWLVCLAVWMALGSKDIVSKLFAIWFPVMAFVAIGFQHVVANMFFIPAGIFVGAPVSWGSAIVEWIAAFIGNAIGGWLFVAVAYYVAYMRHRGKDAATDVAGASKTGATL